MGKGKSSETQAAKEHVSRPLATLKDPSLFGPPPKHVNYHGGAALPNEITPHRSGLGAPLTQTEISGASQAVQSPQPVEEEEESAKPPPPSLPYRADRTGLRTDNLPPPPVHRDLNKSAATPPPPPTRSPAPGPQPRLPPRLPSRQNTLSPPINEPPPPSYDAVAPKPSPSPVPTPTQTSYINQSAASRLGQAGVSIPAFGIGNQGESNPWQAEKSQARPSGTNQLSELQSRFARMNSHEPAIVPSPTTQPSDHPTNPNAMPSWKQSQSAFNTAQTLRTNPQNVSLADARSAAQTAGQAQRSANAFREKHADQIAAAQTKAKAWDQRYKVTSKLNKFLDEHTEAEDSTQQANMQNSQGMQQTQPLPGQLGQQFQPTASAISTYSPSQPSASVPHITPQSPAPTEISASIARKPPPPPAPRKPANLQAPPPVPMGTKPSFG